MRRACKPTCMRAYMHASQHAPVTAGPTDLGFRLQNSAASKLRTSNCSRLRRKISAVGNVNHLALLQLAPLEWRQHAAQHAPQPPDLACSQSCPARTALLAQGAAIAPNKDIRDTWRFHTVWRVSNGWNPTSRHRSMHMETRMLNSTCYNGAKPASLLSAPAVFTSPCCSMH